ncbi:hypothetical protein EMPS_11533 [Entomortierella parvispora]|uniref:GSKIP domain-containing protein n=1 Tax=Entomortierella parvispora TaxID=205924 RepID=A0A9P3HLW7_9FUNG|nr:hypothetical protein EMPS_11533 [Entomortierella parvispora]
MEHMIPDLTHYARGLDSATFPLKVSEVPGGEHGKGQAVQFTVVTLEKLAAELLLDDRGFKVLTIHTPASEETSEPYSTRQQEALSGMIYETIEALLMAISPAFEDFFGQELSRKLSSLTWERPQYNSGTESESDPESKEQSIEK